MSFHNYFFTLVYQTQPERNQSPIGLFAFLLTYDLNFYIDSIVYKNRLFEIPLFDSLEGNGGSLYKTGTIQTTGGDRHTAHPVGDPLAEGRSRSKFYIRMELVEIPGYTAKIYNILEITVN